MDLTQNGAAYGMSTTQIVAGIESPVDSLMIDNKLYVVSFVSGANIYEITFPLLHSDLDQ